MRVRCQRNICVSADRRFIARATPSSSAAATLAGLIFSLPGLLLGPSLGAVIGELTDGRELTHATRVGVGTWLGLLFGTLAKLALCFAMLGPFALAFIIG